MAVGRVLDDGAARRLVMAAYANALRRERHVLGTRPDLTWQQLSNRFAWLAQPARDLLADHSERMRGARTPWLRARFPPAESGALVVTLVGHADDVNTCAISPDGATIVSAGEDATLRIWDLATGTEHMKLVGHQAAVSDCSISPDGAWILSASRDQTLKVWDATTGAELVTLSGHTEAVSACAFFPGGRSVLSVSSDGTLRVWDAVRGSELRRINSGIGGLWSCAASADGSWVVAASVHRLRTWRVADWEVLATSNETSGWIEACAVVPDATSVATASRAMPEDYLPDCSVRLWAADDLEHRRWVVNHDVGISDCAVSPDGAFLVNANEDGTLDLTSLAGDRRSVLVGHGVGANGCTVSADGHTVASAGRDGTVRVWDVGAAGDGGPPPRRHADWLSACAVSPDGSFVVSASWDRTLKIWDAASGDERHTLSGHSRPVQSCAVSPGGDWIVSASGGLEWDDELPDTTLRIWDPVGGRERATFDHGHLRWVRRCRVSPDGEQIVTASEDGTVRVWDARSGTHRHTLEHGDRVLDCAVSADSAWVASTSADGALHVWDLASGRLVGRVEAHHGPATGCAIVADGATILTVGADATIATWDVATRARRSVLSGRGGFTACALSADSRLLATAGGQSHPSLEVWDLADQRRLATFPLAGATHCVEFHPDRPLLVGGGTDCTLSFLELMDADRAETAE